MPEDRSMDARMSAAEANIIHLFSNSSERHQENVAHLNKLDEKIDKNTDRSTREHNELRDKFDALQTTNDRQIGGIRTIIWMLGIFAAALFGWGSGFWAHVYHSVFG